MLKKLLIILGAVLLLLALFVGGVVLYSVSYTVPEQAATVENTTGLVQASGRALYDAQGQLLQLNGINAGQILVQEGWMSPFALEPLKNEDGTYTVMTVYGDKTVKAYEAMADRCLSCKSKRLVVFDELIGEQGEVVTDCDRFDMVEKLEAMTAVCSVGLDMIAIPGDTTAEVISGIIADEISIGVANTKTTAVRLIPVEGKGVGEMVEFGGLLGSAPIMRVNTASPAKFIRRGGRVPAPIHSLKN